MGNTSTHSNSYVHVIRQEQIQKPVHIHKTKNHLEKTASTPNTQRKSEERKIHKKLQLMVTETQSKNKDLLKEASETRELFLKCPVQNRTKKTSKFKHPNYIEKRDFVPAKEKKNRRIYRLCTTPISSTLPTFIPKAEYIAGTYEILSVEKIGLFGTIYQTRHCIYNKLFSIKKIPRYRRARRDKYCTDYSLIKEIELLMDIDNINVLAVHEVIHDEENDCAYFVLEYIKKPLVLREDGRIIKYQEWEARKYYRQLLRGLDHLLLQYRTIHGSICAENVLLGEDDYIKICSFGYRNVCYLPPTKRPETQNKFDYAKSSDVFASGVLLFVMVFGAEPPNTTEEKMKIIEKSSISQELKDLLRNVLEEDPEKRITLAELLYDPWVTNNNTFSPVESYIPTIKIEPCKF